MSDNTDMFVLEVPQHGKCTLSVMLDVFPGCKFMETDYL